MLQCIHKEAIKLIYLAGLKLLRRMLLYVDHQSPVGWTTTTLLQQQQQQQKQWQ